MTVSLILALMLAGLIGLSLGALGSGGSIVTLPVLVYVAGIPVKTAVGMSIAIVGATALAGAYLNYRQGQLKLRVTLLFALTGVVAAYFGSTLTHLVSSHVLMLVFAALMLAVGAAMLRRRPEETQGERCRAIRCLAAGGVVGTLTGFLGVGGGFLIVPALVLAAGLTTRQAVGTSLAIIALNSTSGVIGQLRYATLDPKLTLGFLAVALLGMNFGLKLAGRLSEQALRRVFAWAVLVMSFVIGFLNLKDLISGGP